MARADVVVTVTATVTDGLGWGQLPEGGVRVDAATATLTVDVVEDVV